MRILVTGGSGFLGRSVVPILVERGHTPCCLARSAEARRAVESMGGESLDGDLDQPQQLKEAFKSANADALCNLASLGFGHAAGLVDAAVSAGIRRSLFVSTTSVFTSLPASSKSVRTEAEELIMSSGLDWTIVRPTMIYGNPGDRNMFRLLRLLQRSPIVPLPGGGKHLIQPVHVDDLARFICHLVLEQDESIHQAINVPGPKALTLREVVALSAAAIGRRPVYLSIPLRPVLKVVGAYERLAREPRIKQEQILRLDEDKAFNPHLAESLGYRGRSFVTGIEEEVGMVKGVVPQT